MKVAFVTPYPAPGAAAVGGVEVAATRLPEALQVQGIDVTVIGLRGAGGEPASPVPVIRLDADKRWSMLRNLRPLTKKLADELADLRPDIVHTQTLVPAGYAATSLAPPRPPTVITVHGNRRQDTMSLYRGVSARARWLLAKRMTDRAASRADAIVGVHPDWRLTLPSNPSRFFWIPNIIDERFFSAERRPDGMRVLYCGGPRRIKGWDLLLEAWPLVLRRIPHARLHAPGCARALGDLPADVAASIDVEGWLSSEQLAGAMARATVVVLPSRFDLAPIAIGEAWAVGVPVVAAAVGGIPALAEGAARLFHDSGPAVLSDQIVAVLNDDGAKSAIVEEGRRRVEAQRAERVAAAHVDVYESLLGREPCARR